MTRSPGRTGHRWRTVAAQVKREEHTCWLCGQVIDLTLPPRTPWSFTVDHVLPLHHGGHPTDRTNLRAAHLRCNVARQNRCDLCRPQHRLITSRPW